MAGGLELLAVCWGRSDDFERCARLLGAARHSRDEAAYLYRFRDLSAWTIDLQQRAISSIGQTAWNEAFEAGRNLDPAAAAEYAGRGRGERKRPTAGWDALTPTERQVVALLTDGLSNPQIAAALLMAVTTVKTHVSSALSKLGMRTRTQLATASARRNI